MNALKIIIALWLSLRLLRLALRKLKTAKRKPKQKHFPVYNEPETGGFEFDNDYPYEAQSEREPEPKKDCEKSVIAQNRIDNITGLIQENWNIIEAIDKELSGTIRDSRRTTLLTKKANIAEKIYRLEKQIDKERESL